VKAYKGEDPTTWPVDPMWVDLETLKDADFGPKCSSPPADWPGQEFFAATLDFAFDPLAFYTQYCVSNPTGKHCELDLAAMAPPTNRRRLM